MPRAAALRGEVPALGEDQHGAVVGEPAAHRGDLDLRVAAARVDEAVRQPVPEHVDQRVEPERLVQHEARAAAVPAQQLVEHEQRVALARVAAEHHDRPLAAPSAASAASEPSTGPVTRAQRTIEP